MLTIAYYLLLSYSLLGTFTTIASLSNLWVLIVVIGTNLIKNHTVVE